MCLDFHPVHNSLLAVGCHDGTVMVFDVRHKANRPIYSSSIKTGKHTDPVWQVRRTRVCVGMRNLSYDEDPIYLDTDLKEAKSQWIPMTL